MSVKRVFEGLTVVTVGVILLANTTGALPWGVWWTILMLWPLLLVAAGIDILGKSLDSTFLRVLGSIVVIGGLAYGALTGISGVRTPVLPLTVGASRPFSFSQPRVLAVRAGMAKVNGGLTKVTLRADDVLASAQGETPFGEPSFSAKVETDLATIDIDSGGHGSTGSVHSRAFMDVTLDRDIIWERLQVGGGLSQVDLDMSALKVGALIADLGLSNSTVTFGESSRTPNVQATLKAGLSTLRVRIPKSIGVELESTNGLTSLSLGPGWTRVADRGPGQGLWRTEGFEATALKLGIKLEAGLSSVTIERF